MLQKLIYCIYVFMSSNFFGFYVFLFLELFSDEPAMVLQYSLVFAHDKNELYVKGFCQIIKPLPNIFQ
jgi:hypothetical protein